METTASLGPVLISYETEMTLLLVETSASAIVHGSTLGGKETGGSVGLDTGGIVGAGVGGTVGEVVGARVGAGVGAEVVEDVGAGVGEPPHGLEPVKVFTSLAPNSAPSKIGSLPPLRKPL